MNTEKKIHRENVPQQTRLKLWVKAAGRCEFRGCNKPVWRNGLTLNDGNFGEVAHIIAASEDGPRGGKESTELRIEFSNLMLLCQRCHKAIDDNPEKYTSELLRKWKHEHENRIEIQTSYPEDIYKSTVVLFTVNIADRIVPINTEAYRNAMFPKFPVDEKGIKIARDDFNRDGNEAYWTAYAGDIERKIKSLFEEGIDEKVIKHLSVFAIGPMPLLMFLGKCIGDTIPADLYQAHRNIADTNHTWSWPVDEQETDTSYIVNHHRVNNTDENVAMVLSISGKISRDRYELFPEEHCSIYEITVTDPSVHFLKSRKQLEGFSRVYRNLLNHIQATHGDLCRVSIIPAVPVSIAVECGRAILPTSDPDIFVCEYDGQGGYRKVLKIN